VVKKASISDVYNDSSWTYSPGVTRSVFSPLLYLLSYLGNISKHILRGLKHFVNGMQFLLLAYIAFSPLFLGIISMATDWSKEYMFPSVIFSTQRLTMEVLFTVFLSSNRRSEAEVCFPPRAPPF